MGFRHWASTPPVSRRSRQSATGPPGSYPDRTHTGKRRRADDTRSTTYTVNLLSLGARKGLSGKRQGRTQHPEPASPHPRPRPPRHPDLHSASMLAHDLYRTGNVNAARALNEQTLSEYRRILGDDHPNTLHSANDLATWLRHTGEYRAAKKPRCRYPCPSPPRPRREPPRHHCLTKQSGPRPSVLRRRSSR